MKSVPKIIKEEVRSFLKEIDEDIHDMYEARGNVINEIFYDFINENNENFTKNIRWQVVPYSRLKKVWEDYIRFGKVQHVKSIDYIERIIIRCSLRISAITELAGHTVHGEGEELFEEHVGYFIDEEIRCYNQTPDDLNQLEIPYNDPNAAHERKLPQDKCSEVNPFVKQFIDNNGNDNLREKLMDLFQNLFFNNYLVDPKSGHMYISDYGLPAIEQLTTQLYGEDSPEIKLQTIDKILNVVHQRSDLASWFIEGGSGALSDLSGYDIPDEEHGGYTTKSTISGRYKMGDYH